MRIILLAYFAVVNPACANAQRTGEVTVSTGLPVIALINEMPQPKLSKVEIMGDSMKGESLRYVATINGTSDNLILESYLNGNLFGSTSLPMQKYHNIDISTIQVSYDDIRMATKIKFQFGERRICFANYDGRDMVSVLFEQGRQTTRVESFSGCEKDR